MHTRGFTFIELLLVIALSSLLLLVAAMTFRSITRSLKDIERIGEENRLIRTGIYVSLQDADYWHSHANPGYPYLQRHQIDNPDNASDLEKAEIFRSVAWAKDLDDPTNPNWMQPHDPRSWYRNHLTPNIQMGGYGGYYGSISNRANPGLVGFVPDAFVTMPLGELWKIVNNSQETRTKYPRVPPAWEPWHIVGDYASLSNVEMDTTANEQEKLAGSRPVALWHAFKQLGIRGQDSYGVPGAISHVLLSSRNETLANYSSPEIIANTYYSRGEIPFMLGGSTLGHATKKENIREAAIRILDGPRGDDMLSYPASFKTDFPDFGSGHLAANLPIHAWNNSGNSSQNSTDGRANNTNLDGVVHTFNYRDDGLGVLGNLCGDLNIFTSRLHQPWWAGKTGAARSVAGRGKSVCWYPPSPRVANAAGDAFNWAETKWLQRKPFDYLEREEFDLHTRKTWRLPLNATDDPEPDLSLATAGTMSLQTGILRYKSYGTDRAYCTVALQRDNDERSIEFRFSVLSTNLRGARQHWGALSGAAGVSDNFGNSVKMGDIYE